MLVSCFTLTLYTFRRRLTTSLASAWFLNVIRISPCSLISLSSFDIVYRGIEGHEVPPQINLVKVVLKSPEVMSELIVYCLKRTKSAHGITNLNKLPKLTRTISMTNQRPGFCHVSYRVDALRASTRAGKKYITLRITLVNSDNTTMSDPRHWSRWTCVSWNPEGSCSETLAGEVAWCIPTSLATRAGRDSVSLWRRRWKKSSSLSDTLEFGPGPFETLVWFQLLVFLDLVWLNCPVGKRFLPVTVCHQSSALSSSALRVFFRCWRLQWTLRHLCFSSESLHNGSWKRLQAFPRWHPFFLSVP
eukprot:sb/3467292/